MPKVDPKSTSPNPKALAKLRAICSALPDTHETLTWGSPHFRVGEKIFTGLGDENGRLVIGFKLEAEHAAQMIQVDGYWPSPYVGRYGWVSTALTPRTNWKTMQAFVEESYRLIAPKAKKATKGGSKARARR